MGTSGAAADRCQCVHEEGGTVQTSQGPMIGTQVTAIEGVARRIYVDDQSIDKSVHKRNSRSGNETRGVLQLGVATNFRQSLG